MTTKTVLITGCSTGFGAALTRLFAERGWNVVATMRTPAAGADLAKLDNVLVTRLDVQDRASIDTAIAAGINRFGRIDALINNAGFGLFGVFETTPRDKVLEQFEVNVFGVMDVTRALLPHFRANRSGAIVNISSGAGAFALPTMSLYSASKFALEGFSESLWYELRGLGVAVKIVEPGGVMETDFSKRMASEAGGEVIADYGPFLAEAGEIFAGLSTAPNMRTTRDVAEVIFDATTDGRDQLRYLAADDVLPLIKARRETSEERYMAFMRERFAR